MKYLVKTSETELWEKYYEVEADSGDEAEEIVRTWDLYHLLDHSEKYIETTDVEILEIEPYNEN